MKIAILTLPLHSNIGGILQLWALQQTLRALGHEPIALRMRFKRHPKVLWPLAFCHRLWLRCAARLRGRREAIPLLPGLSEALAERRIRPWIRTHLARTAPVASERDLQRWIRQHPVDAVIFGSDQIWNPAWTRPLYFGSFLNGTPVCRIAVAASFGNSDPDFGTRVSRYRRWLEAFDAVSVRESEGVAICERLFGRRPSLCPDPTLFLPPETWERLLPASDARPRTPGVLRLTHCFLSARTDNTPALRTCLDGLRAAGLTLQSTTLHTPNNPAPGLFPALPSVEAWLCAIRDADAIVTDSFHAVVFSLLFGRPFLAFAKPEEDSAGRLTTLLDRFGLSVRLIRPGETPDFRLLLEPLPASRTEILQTLCAEGHAFLTQALVKPEKPISQSADPGDDSSPT